jgi:4-nitrophenyl phosphatase
MDADGTLWRGPLPLPGLAGLFDFLHRQNLAYRIVTNSTVETPAHYRQKLADFGVKVNQEHILTAAVATAAYLQDHFPVGASVFMIGEEGLRTALNQAGFTLAADAGRAVDAVVVGGDTGLTYAKLKQAILLIQKGAALIGTNPDLLVPTEEGLVPEAGTTLAALQAATGVAPIIIGKPEPILFELAMRQMGSHPGETAMLGDRLETDILGGQRAGLTTLLVTTGVDNTRTIPQKGIQPDLVMSGLDEFIELWQGEYD